MPTEAEYSDEIKELVIQRIKDMPEGIKLCFGDNLVLSQTEMIASINSDDEIGHEIIKMHLEYLKSIKNLV
jgi:hypothetical protein